jgi:hypothetical protein
MAVQMVQLHPQQALLLLVTELNTHLPQQDQQVKF